MSAVSKGQPVAIADAAMKQSIGGIVRPLHLSRAYRSAAATATRRTSVTRARGIGPSSPAYRLNCAASFVPCNTSCTMAGNTRTSSPSCSACWRIRTASCMRPLKWSIQTPESTITRLRTAQAVDRTLRRSFRTSYPREKPPLPAAARIFAYALRRAEAPATTLSANSTVSRFVRVPAAFMAARMRRSLITMLVRTTRLYTLLCISSGAPRPIDRGTPAALGRRACQHAKPCC